MQSPVIVNPTKMHARLLVTSHGRNRQNMQFELAATTRKKQWMCGSHINRHGDEKGRSDQRRYNSNNVCCLKRKHTP